MKKFLVLGNVLLSGIIALLISWFYAEGALGESSLFTPQFFLILPVWAICVRIMWLLVFKNKIENASNLKIIVSNILLWLAIPIGLMTAFQFI